MGGEVDKVISLGDGEVGKEEKSDANMGGLHAEVPAPADLLLRVTEELEEPVSCPDSDVCLGIADNVMALTSGSILSR